ncbi:MAG TPA: glycosyltransferase, partial [Parafilimonas sp.]|nr:glycosyltransferase [Parafilimonas sp.]
IIVSSQQWYTDIGSTCKNLAHEFAKDNRVLYINAPLDRKTILYSKNDVNIQRHLNIIKNNEERIIEVEKNIWNYYPANIIESINWIPFTSIFSIVNKRNNKKFAEDIKVAIEKLNFKNFIIFNDNDIFRSYYLKEFLNPKLYIYCDRDNLLGVDYWKKHGIELEAKLIAKSDLVVANAHSLTEYSLKHNPNSHYFGMGCNIELFNGRKKFPLPDDMQNIPHPIVGYVGVLTSLRIDTSIIKAIAKAHPNYSVVMVGPYDLLNNKHEIDNLPNIYFLGKKPVSALPAYVQALDVCINPQVINDITMVNYPLKIDEYLAMGKPVVATKTKEMEMFDDCIYLGETPEDHAALVEKALAEDNDNLKEYRITLAESHTWEIAAGKIFSAINKTLSN